MAQEIPRGVVTLVFTDIEGSSDLWHQFGTEFKPVLDEHNRILREAIPRWNGFEVKTEGDSFVAAFGHASDAIQFAVDVQLQLARCPWTFLLAELSQLRVRIGMHTGEVQVERAPDGGFDYFGVAANLAARVCSAGHGGQILVSEETRSLALPELQALGEVHPRVLEVLDAAREQDAPLAAKVRFVELGVHRMKGVGEARLWQVVHPDLESSFPPLRTLSSARHNLPVPPTSFLGRERELEEWLELLLEPSVRLLTLTGFGGMGKSRAALQLAETALGRFPGGVWWIELEEDRDGAALFSRIAQVLGIKLEPQTPVREQVIAYLRDREALLVLDNTEQIPDAGKAIAALLQGAGKLKALVTSRQALGIKLEHLMPVPPLEASAGELLFVERARAQEPQFRPDAATHRQIALLCRRLEGVPLALELAASRIRQLSVGELLERLDEPLRILKQRAPDLPPRQQALRAAIDWSYELLGSEEQSVLQQLSVFQCGFSQRDAEAVCEAEDVLESVGELISRSFLRTAADPRSGEKRFSMLETVRYYSREKLDEAPEQASAARRRLADYVLTLGERWSQLLDSPDEVAALARLEECLTLLKAAQAWFREAGEPEKSARAALIAGRVLGRLGFTQEAIACLDAGLECAQNPALKVQLLLSRERIHLDCLDPPTAYRHLDEASRLSAELGDRRLLSDCRNLIALVSMRKGNLDAARDLLKDLRGELERTGDSMRLARVLINLGLIERARPGGNLDRVEEYWSAALDLERRTGSPSAVAICVNNMGVLAFDRGRLDEAWDFYEEALRTEIELRSVFGVARALANLGEVAAKRGDGPAAARLCLAAEVLFDRVGSPHRDPMRRELAGLAAHYSLPFHVEKTRGDLQAMRLEEVAVWARARAEAVTLESTL